MTVIPFPSARRVEISEPGEVSAIESTICAIGGLLGASGGFVAIAGRRLDGTPVVERIRLLTRMYDEGEIVIGFHDARIDAIANIVIEKLALPRRPTPGWRAELFVEDADGHASIGALAAADAETLGLDLLRAVSRGLDAPLPTAGAALLSLGRA